MQRNVVLFPEPLGPSKVKNCPSAISMFTSWTARTSPLSTTKLFLKLSILNINLYSPIMLNLNRCIVLPRTARLLTESHVAFFLIRFENRQTDLESRFGPSAIRIKLFRFSDRFAQRQQCTRHRRSSLAGIART